MPKLIDRAGQIFDTWEVIERLPSRKGKVYWRCRCQKCGTEKEISSSNLSSHTYAICKCSSNEYHTQKMSVDAKNIRICPICGKSFVPILHGETRKYCFECSPQGQTRSATITGIRRAIKKQLIQYKGGKCEICGYDKCQAALQFHHIDPQEKDFEISTELTNNIIDMDSYYKEVDKCILVCANCHAELHWQPNDIKD